MSHDIVTSKPTMVLSNLIRRYDLIDTVPLFVVNVFSFSNLAFIANDLSNYEKNRMYSQDPISCTPDIITDVQYFS